MQQQVVGGNLVKDFLRDGYMRRFVLYNHARTGIRAIEDAVATQLFVAASQFHFILEQGRR